MVISQNKVVFTAEGVREFHISRSVSLMKLEVISGTVKVEGRMTQDSPYTQIAGVQADLNKSSVASKGITSFEVSGFYQVKLTYEGSEPVYSTLIG